MGCTYLFFDALLRSAESHRVPQTTKLHGFYIDSALSFIEKNFQTDVSVEDIARYIGLNRSYFGKIFKEGMGVSPQKFLMGYRMEKACELLKLSSLSIGRSDAPWATPTSSTSRARSATPMARRLARGASSTP